MRHLYRARGWRACAVVSGPARRATGAGDQDGRGDGRRRPAPSASAGLRGARRRPVRLLHPRHSPHRRGSPRGPSHPEPRRGARRPGRQSLPLYRLHEDSRRGGAGRPPDEGGASMTHGKFSVIGQSLPKIDAWAKVTGETRFADDLVLPRMAYAKLLRSPHPHARLRRVDVSKAAALPGVLATLVGSELPIPFGILPVSQDEHALALDKVRFVGDPVAAVAALDEEIAEAAGKLIEVDYEVLPPLMSIDEALARPDARIHEYGPRGNVHKEVSFDFGDVEAGFREADHVREDTFYFEGSTHLPLEQHAAVASFGPDGKLTLWSSTQTPHYVHRALAKVLEMSPAHVRVIACPNGGGFGGKSDPFGHEIVASKLSMK